MQVSIRGASTYVETFGTEERRGPVVLLLHGNPDSSRLWTEAVSRLGGDLRCFAPDLPGFGLSELPTGYDFTLESHVSWLDAVLEEVSRKLASPALFSRIHLVVHDFGGPYGLAWASRHTNRVASVLAGDTLFFSDYRWHLWGRLWRTPLLGEICMPLMGWHFFRFIVRRHSPGLSDEHLAMAWSLVTPEVKRTVLRLYRATDPEVFRGWEDRSKDLLATVPSLALWGENDPYIASPWAHRLGARSVEIVPGFGHWLPAEAPDLFAEKLRELIAEAEAR